MKKPKQVAAAFVTFWLVQATHWYLVSEFSKFKRFDPVWSTLYALVFTAVGLSLGWAFRWKPAGDAWHRLGRWTFLLSVAGLFLVVHDYILWRQWLDGIPTPGRGWPDLGCFLIGFPLLHLFSNRSAQPGGTDNSGAAPLRV